MDDAEALQVLIESNARRAAVLAEINLAVHPQIVQSDRFECMIEALCDALLTPSQEVQLNLEIANRFAEHLDESEALAASPQVQQQIMALKMQKAGLVGANGQVPPLSP